MLLSIFFSCFLSLHSAFSIYLSRKEANVLELHKRYSNLYVPSDVFLARPLWSDTFPAHRAFQFPRPVSFHITNKEVDPVIENTAIYDPPDINHSYAAKVSSWGTHSIQILSAIGFTLVQILIILVNGL